MHALKLLFFYAFSCLPPNEDYLVLEPENEIFQKETLQTLQDILTEIQIGKLIWRDIFRILF